MLKSKINPHIPLKIYIISKYETYQVGFNFALFNIQQIEIGLCIDILVTSSIKAIS